MPSIKTILKAIKDTFFGTKFKGGQNFLNLLWEVFFQKESTLGLTGWTDMERKERLKKVLKY